MQTKPKEQEQFSVTYRQEIEEAIAWADAIVAGRKRSIGDCTHLAFMSKALKDFMEEV